MGLHSPKHKEAHQPSPGPFKPPTPAFPSTSARTAADEMGRGLITAAVYITVAVLLLLLVSHSPRQQPAHRRHRRLKLRSAFSFDQGGRPHHDPTPFDPLVADIERRREDKEWERRYFEGHGFHAAGSAGAGGGDEHAPAAEAQPEWEDFMDAEEYINDEDRFNLTHRLLLLFPKVDVDPADGFVDGNELTEWHAKNSEREVMHRTERDMEVHDKNHDGLISFQEYEAPGWARRPDNVSDDVGWWKEDHFNASDADGDGYLTITEFNDFLHPADTKNPKLLRWLCTEEIRERDTDKDGKLNFNEFFHGIFDLIRDYDEGYNASHSNDSMEAPAKKIFADLDRDKDGFLSEEELLSVIDKLHPSERYYAKQQADYILQQADEDKDGRLSLQDMINNPYVFYGSIFGEDEDDDYFHDEFR